MKWIHSGCTQHSLDQAPRIQPKRCAIEIARNFGKRMIFSMNYSANETSETLTIYGDCATGDLWAEVESSEEKRSENSEVVTTQKFYNIKAVLDQKKAKLDFAFGDYRLQVNLAYYWLAEVAHLNGSETAYTSVQNGDHTYVAAYTSKPVGPEVRVIGQRIFLMKDLFEGVSHYELQNTKRKIKIVNDEEAYVSFNTYALYDADVNNDGFKLDNDSASDIETFWAQGDVFKWLSSFEWTQVTK